MKLLYSHQLSPKDSSIELIMESETLAPFIEAIESFWNNLNFPLSYFRYIDFEEDGIGIDFGLYNRFYFIQGYSGSFREFVNECEALRDKDKIYMYK